MEDARKIIPTKQNKFDFHKLSLSTIILRKIREIKIKL